MILVDSNILIYAINRSSPKHKKAQQFIRQNLRNICVAQQNVVETLRVLTHPVFPLPMKSKDALVAVDAIVTSLHLIGPTHETYMLTCMLMQKYDMSSNKIFDAYLVATMLSNGVHAIATDNERDFMVYEEIQVMREV